MLSSPRLLVVVSIAIGAIGACGGTTSSAVDTTDASARVCVPGQSVACVGTGGCAGGQVCNADGSAFEACICGSGVDASLVDSSMLDGAPSDATPRDGALVDGGAKDGSIADSGSRDGAMFDAATCAPGSVTTFQPVYHPPTPPQSVCTSAQLAGYYTACLDVGQTMATCTAWKSANATCAPCISSDSTATTYAALIVNNGVISVNVAGCMALLDSVNGDSCAHAAQAADQCDEAACAANCPVIDDASFQLYIACIQQAASNGCQTYSQASTACQTAEAADGGAADACLQGQTFQDYYNTIAPIFCSGGG